MCYTGRRFIVDNKNPLEQVYDIPITYIFVHEEDISIDQVWAGENLNLII